MEKWTHNDINFIKENYTKLTNKELSISINKSINSVRYKLKCLLLIRESKYDKINFSLYNVNDLYIMGFLWADGYLHDTKNRLELSIVTEDFNDINGLFDIKKWAIQHRNRLNRKPQTTLGLYKYDICNIFRNVYNYTEKSYECPNFIDKIPKDLLHYFIRGFFDGDGSFYISKDNTLKQCYLAGTYEQDWSWLEDILNNLNIKYSIKKKIQKENQKYSIIYIYKKDINKFGDFIYQNYIFDKIGLKRKYEKYNSF